MVLYSNKIHIDPEELEHNEDSDLGGDGEEEETKKEYVKKVYVAKPYNSDGVTEAAVNNLIIKNTRLEKLISQFIVSLDPHTSIVCLK